MLQLRAWLAARGGDPEVERRQLQSLVSRAPGQISAWDRLAELALLRGRPAEAEEFRKQKAEFNRRREEYKRLIARDDRSSHCRRLATLAEELGRRIEARGWSLIEQGRAGAEPLRLSGEDGTGSAAAGEWLSSAMADLASAVPAGPARPAADHSGRSPRFVDDAEAAGLRWLHDNGHTRPKSTASGSDVRRSRLAGLRR